MIIIAYILDKKDSIRSSRLQQDSQGSLRQLKSRRGDNPNQRRIWICLGGLRNITDNCVYVAAKSYVVSPQGEKLKDLGQIEQKPDSAIIDFDIQGKLWVETTMFEIYKELIWVCELTVLEDASPVFFGKLLGVLVVRLSANGNSSEEIPIYFENPTNLELLLEKWTNNEAEHLPGSSALVQVSQEEPASALNPKGYALSNVLTTRADDQVRQYLRKQAKPKTLEKVLTIFENLRNLDPSFPLIQEREEAFRELRQRVSQTAEGYIWSSSKYLMPYEVSSKKIFVKIEGFLNLDRELLFCRFLINPDSKGRKRPLYNPGFLDFEASNTLFQIVKGRPIEIDLPVITEKHAILIELLRVVYEPNQPKIPKVLPAGLAMYPLRNDDGYLSVGKAFLPVFDPGLDWETVEEFAKYSILEMYQAFYEQEEDIGITDSFVFITVTDEYHKDLFKDFMDFSKLDFDYVIQPEDDNQVKLNSDSLSQRIRHLKSIINLNLSCLRRKTEAFWSCFLLIRLSKTSSK